MLWISVPTSQNLLTLFSVQLFLLFLTLFAHDVRIHVKSDQILSARVTAPTYVWSSWSLYSYIPYTIKAPQLREPWYRAVETGIDIGVEVASRLGIEPLIPVDDNEGGGVNVTKMCISNQRH